MVINSTEYQAKQYYFHQYYANTYYRVYLSLEDWISTNIFRKDTSRVFLASPEYAFRRRFELTDSNKTDYEKAQASSLHFPFASYWPLNSGWQADERVAANTAAQVYRGIYEGNTLLKAASVVLTIPIQFYFDREDDARLAYEAMFFKTFNPHYYTTTVAYGSNSVGLPVVMTIKNLQFNPQFKESDWLKQNRIFVITADFDIRSYILRTPDQPEAEYLVGDEGYLIDENGNIVVDEDGIPVKYEPGVTSYYIVKNVLLNFNSDSWKYETYQCDSEDSCSGFPEQGKVGVVYINAFNKNVDSKNWYIYSQSQGWIKSETTDYDSDFTYQSFDHSVVDESKELSGEWIGFPKNPKENVVYIDIYTEDRENITYINKNQWIWNPYSESYEHFNEQKLNANAINIYGKISINTTKISFLQTTSTSDEVTISWIYLNQSHDISSIKYRKQGDTEWLSINSNSTSCIISNLAPLSSYTFEFEFSFAGDTSSETSVLIKTISVDTNSSSEPYPEDKSSLIGVKW